MFKLNKKFCDFSKTYLLQNFRQKTRFKNLVLSSTSEPKYASTSSALLTNQTDTNNYPNFSNTASKLTSVVKEGKKIFLRECKKLGEEYKESFILNTEPFKIRDPRHTTDMLFTFESEESLNNFLVTTDSSNNAGYSSASLKITQDKTALFSGHISTEVPKTGNIFKSGFANMMSLRKTKAFFRHSYHNWTYYTHLVLKLRGDGRAYSVVLPTPGDSGETMYEIHMYPLYTRGGPYWQIVKIPFSHFYSLNKGRINDQQEPLTPNCIAKFGITIADGINGPFKLEIDYVGLERFDVNKQASPYELYYIGKH